MKKNLCIALIFVLLVFALALSALASDKVVYVRDGGTGNGLSATTPVGSLAAAANALGGAGGSIVLVGDTTISSKTTIPEQADDLTITAQDGAKLIIRHRFQFAKNTNANVITLDLPIDLAADFACFMFGGCNNIVFTKNCVMTNSGGGTLNFCGGLQASEAEDIDELIITLPYSITVENGRFDSFIGGHFRNMSDVYVGTIAAPISIDISGGRFGTAGDYSDALSPIKLFPAFSVSGMNFLADDATLTISGGTFYTPIYISGRLGTIHSPTQNISKKIATDRDYYAQDGDVTVNISGGIFLGGAVCDTYVDTGYSRLMRGDYTVTVTGGSFKEGTVFDATQVKPYAGENKKATITYPAGLGITAKRFDVVNGAQVSYTEPTRVAFIGDSITEGHSSGNALTNSYPAQYLSLELAAGHDVIVSDLGVSASGMLPSTKYYYPEMLPAPLALEEVDADIYFFALGTNDAYSSGAANGTAAHFYDEYKTLIKACGDLADTDAVYISSALYRGRGVGPYSMRAANVMRPIQKKIADELAAAEPGKYHFVDLYTLTLDAIFAEELFSDDNLHPDAAGYAVMAQKVYDALHSGVYGVDGFGLRDVYLSATGREFGLGTEEDPASSLSFALSRCAGDATIHVIGVCDHNTTVAVPENLTSLTFKGEGSGAAIHFTADATFRLGCDVTFDDIAVTVASGKYVGIFGEYHNVTFTETFTSSGTLWFYAGRYVRESRDLVDVYTTSTYDTAASASSDADITVNVLGGTFTSLSAGGRRFASNSPFGTYGGDMIFNVGENVVVTDATNSGIVGMHYLTGSITANIDGWGSVALKDNMRLGSIAPSVTYDLANNTGKLPVNLANTVTAPRVVTGDFDNDGALSVSDVLAALRAVCDGQSGGASANFYEVTTLKLSHVLHLLRMIVK